MSLFRNNTMIKCWLKLLDFMTKCNKFVFVFENKYVFFTHFSNHILIIKKTRLG